MTPPYNPIYERLVDSAEDGHNELVGYVAYSLYKKSKREWAERVRTRYDRKPTEEELRDYVDTWTDSRILGLKGEAASILAAYASYVISSEEPRILREAAKGTFWRSVWPSVVATLIYTVGLIVLAVILARVGIDLISLLRTAATS